MSKQPLIAVIDDDDPFRAALVESLLSLGYDARGYACAGDFVTSDRHVACDCVITDIQMPGMSGLELKRLLTTVQCGVPVIMITARSDPDLEARAAAVGAVCLLRKPFATAALLNSLKLALDA